MHENDIKLLEESFKKYYFDHFDLIHVPEKPSEREFGYQKFDSGMIRHLSVKDDKELHLMLITNKPSDVYCSNAYYSFPSLPMQEKDWKEADLIFDIDSKDLNLQCRASHTCFKCNSCGEVSQNHLACPSCNSSKIESKSLTCSNCISGAKKETQKLTEILIADLGVNKEDIHEYFSGNEGFHVYVYNSQFQKVASRERADLADYIMFHGAIPDKFGMKKFNPDRNSFPELDEKGWRGRVSKELFGTKSKRPKIITQIMAQGYSSFQNQLQEMSNTIGVKIDPNVTMDIHRIFRLPGSINSKSGLAKIFCEDLEKFNPYTDACFIDEESVEINANCPLEFTLKNKKFGPYKKEKVTMPKYAAVYMICKGLASSA
ncbi:MAG: DNA primase small subunit domain-containing protein [Nitrosopumilaceae archaeon]